MADCVDAVTTWSERWEELKRIYGGRRQEIRRTAVGWNPGGWQEDKSITPSGAREFYTVVREGEPLKEPKTVTVTRKVYE